MPHIQGALFCRTGTWLEIGKKSLINKINIMHKNENNYFLNKNFEHFKQKKSYVRGTKNENSKYSLLLNLIELKNYFKKLNKTF